MNLLTVCLLPQVAFAAAVGCAVCLAAGEWPMALRFAAVVVAIGVHLKVEETHHGR